MKNIKVFLWQICFFVINNTFNKYLFLKLVEIKEAILPPLFKAEGYIIHDVAS